MNLELHQIHHQIAAHSGLPPAPVKKLATISFLTASNDRLLLRASNHLIMQQRERHWGVKHSPSYRPSFSGNVSLSITLSSALRLLSCFIIAAFNKSSAAALSTQWMSTSGSMMGISPAATIASANLELLIDYCIYTSFVHFFDH